MKQVFIHIGTHKTGSTSFQRFLADNIEFLQNERIHVYRNKGAHNELHIATVRDGLDTPPIRSCNINDFDEYRKELSNHICNFINEKGSGKFIFSSEHLSYSRTHKECELLRGLFPKDAKFTILLVLRKKEEFLASYKNQIIRTGYGISKEETSPYYVESDSWLLDYDKLIKVFESNFDCLITIQYKNSGILSDLLSHLEIDYCDADKEYRDNIKSLTNPFIHERIKRVVSGTPFESFLRGAYRLLQRFLGIF